MTSDGNIQGKLAIDLPPTWGRKPLDAPAKLVRMIESDAQAVAVSIKASGLKLAYIAALIGKSEGYVSRMRSGKRPVPDKLVKPFCRAVGSRLLEQYQDLRAALEQSERDSISRMAAMLSEAA